MSDAELKISVGEQIISVQKRKVSDGKQIISDQKQILAGGKHIFTDWKQIISVLEQIIATIFCLATSHARRNQKCYGLGRKFQIQNYK